MGISAVLLYAFWTHSSFANLSLFLVALIMFYSPLKKLSGIGVYLTTLTISLERLMSLFALVPSVREPEQPVPLPDFTRGLEFHHVGFTYGDGPVLEDVSFRLERGRRLGLAGRKRGRARARWLTSFFVSTTPPRE